MMMRICPVNKKLICKKYMSISHVELFVALSQKTSPATE